MRKRLKKRLLRLDKAPQPKLKDRFNFFKNSKVWIHIGHTLGYPFKKLNQMSNTSVMFITLCLGMVIIYYIAKASVPKITVTSQSVTELLVAWNTRMGIVGYYIIILLWVNFLILCMRKGDHPPASLQRK